MGKKAVKSSSPAKKATGSKPKAKAKPASVSIEQVCVAALKQLQSLNIDQGLQSEIEWCLGSYRNDGNPVGLYEMAGKALQVFNNLNASQPKAVPSKLMSDIQKALKNK